MNTFSEQAKNFRLRIIISSILLSLVGVGAVFFALHPKHAFGALTTVRQEMNIVDGYLYEVTTTKDQDAWLAQLMTSWKFI